MRPNDIGSVMLSRSHVSWNCVSGTVLRVPQLRSFYLFVCVCVLCLCVSLLFAAAFVMP